MVGRAAELSADELSADKLSADHVGPVVGRPCEQLNTPYVPGGTVADIYIYVYIYMYICIYVYIY